MLFAAEAPGSSGLGRVGAELPLILVFEDDQLMQTVVQVTLGAMFRLSLYPVRRHRKRCNDDAYSRHALPLHPELSVKCAFQLRVSRGPPIAERCSP
jgi:hypothetical protein